MKVGLAVSAPVSVTLPTPVAGVSEVAPYTCTHGQITLPSPYAPVAVPAEEWTSRQRPRTRGHSRRGAFHSPQLLMLSGVGPADHLRDHAIAVAHELPGVGENLQNHLEVHMQWRADRRHTRNRYITGDSGPDGESISTLSFPGVVARRRRRPLLC